jgi:colanic acid/amylovoran biosynthesis protein
MRILLIGQCTLHWGRMEFGNIGNYYIIEPLVKELHHYFPQAEIFTTLQMSDRFCSDERVTVLPMSMYYAWDEQDLSEALKELGAATIYSKTGFLPLQTPFISEVMKSDLVIDFSGDMWGDNANFLGKDRFLVGLIKDRVAQLLGKKTVMIAGSPGPFKEQNTLEFAKAVFANFHLVTNRESVSVELLQRDGFDVSHVSSFACPAFLFQPKPLEDMQSILDDLGLLKKEKPTVGFILCGWNFLQGPFDKWPRDNSEYEPFAEVVEYLTEVLDVRVLLMSHSNGFPIPPQKFQLMHGRDYQVIKQLEKVLRKRGISQNFAAIDNVLDAWQTKAVIGQFDMLISGRIHGAVAGLSQLVPTVIIDYGHEPKAHKLKGFAIETGTQDYIANPGLSGDMIEKTKKCWNNRNIIREHLAQQIPLAQEKARDNFRVLKNLLD